MASGSSSNEGEEKFTCNNPEDSDGKESSSFELSLTSQWMSHLPTDLHTVSLSRLAIPGSHNSGSYSCEVTFGISPDAPSFLKSFMRRPGFRESALMSIVQGWSICQNFDIEEQLEAGIRYFDLKISTKKGSEKFFLVNSLYGTELQEFLEPIQAFLEQHGREVVLLDFQRFYAMKTEHHAALISQILSLFGSKVCARRSLEEMTLKQLWEEGKQVVVFYHDSNGKQFEELWPGCCALSPCPQTDKATECIRKLNSYHSTPKLGFFITQGILTPTLRTVMANLLTNNLLALSKELVPSLRSWIKDSPYSCTHPPNIIVADFVDQNNFIPHVLELNLVRHQILSEGQPIREMDAT